jgi:hypothetical protein
MRIECEYLSLVGVRISLIKNPKRAASKSATRREIRATMFDY